MAFNVDFVKSTRGGLLVVFRNHLYRINSRNKSTSTSYWKCEEKTCRANLRLVNNVLVKSKGDHTHAPPYQKLLKMTPCNKLKGRNVEEFSYPIPRIYRQAAAAAAASADEASTSWIPSFDNIKQSSCNTKEQVVKKEGNSSSSVSEQNNENPNTLRVGNELIVPDVEMQYSGSSEMETQSGTSTSLLSNSGIVIKQEIIETEQESSVLDDSSFHSPFTDGPSEARFDGQTRSTSYTAHSESSNSNADILSSGQSHDEVMEPTLSHGLSTVKVKSGVSSNACARTSEKVTRSDNFQNQNGAFSTAPPSVSPVLNVTVPCRSTRKESIQSRVSPHVPDSSFPPVLNVTGPENSSSNESVQPTVSSPCFNNSSLGISGNNESGVPSHLSLPLPPRDRFDAYGEFVASKLRNLDPKSCSYVQTAFADLIFKAEMGMFANRGEKSTSISRTNDIRKDTPPPHPSGSSLSSSGKENVQPRVPPHTQNPHLPPVLNTTFPDCSSIQTRVSSFVPNQSFPSVPNNSGSESSVRNEPIQPRATSHVENPWPAPDSNLTVPQSLSGNNPVPIRVSSHIGPQSLPPVLNPANDWNNMPIQSRVPFHMRPRDEFDAYGEFAASKLRSLDPRSCAFVQTAFADLIFEAELGRFLSEGERSIFVNKTNDILRNMPPADHSELISLRNVVSTLSGYGTQPQWRYAQPGFYSGEAPLEVIPNLHSAPK